MTDAISEWHDSLSAQPGALYRHFKGGLYVVIAILEDSDVKEGSKAYNEGLMVAYMNLETGKRYWRKLFGEDGFATAKIKEDGTKLQRFTFCGYVEEIKIDTRGRYYVTHKY